MFFVSCSGTRIFSELFLFFSVTPVIPSLKISQTIIIVNSDAHNNQNQYNDSKRIQATTNITTTHYVIGTIRNLKKKPTRSEYLRKPVTFKARCNKSNREKKLPRLYKGIKVDTNRQTKRPMDRVCIGKKLDRSTLASRRILELDRRRTVRSPPPGDASPPPSAWEFSRASELFSATRLPRGRVILRYELALFFINPSAAMDFAGNPRAHGVPRVFFRF